MKNLPTRRFFVVIHTITNGLQHALEQTEIAKRAGADGVFLIPDYAKGNKRATTEDQFLCLKKLKEVLPDFPIGVNFLRAPETLVPRLYTIQPDFFQSDSSSVTGIEKSKLSKTEFFLGVAFKYSQNVHLTGSALKEHCEKVSAIADIPTTSGDATGSAADMQKIREIRSYLSPGARLGIASGVTEQNVQSYLQEGVTDFLVATSLVENVSEIDSSDILSFSKISKMAEIIHTYCD